MISLCKTSFRKATPHPFLFPLLGLMWKLILLCLFPFSLLNPADNPRRAETVFSADQESDKSLPKGRAGNRHAAAVPHHRPGAGGHPVARQPVAASRRSSLFHPAADAECRSEKQEPEGGAANLWLGANPTLNPELQFRKTRRLPLLHWLCVIFLSCPNLIFFNFLNFLCAVKYRTALTFKLTINIGLCVIVFCEGRGNKRL